jgi:MFS transporter, Spinster family, sphingosine-1-phosphate transporter
MLMSFSILLQLFFGGLAVPVMTGYMIAQVPYRMRTLANSLANMFYNLFGFFPAPSIYGLVYEAAGSG